MAWTHALVHLADHRMPNNKQALEMHTWFIQTNLIISFISVVKSNKPRVLLLRGKRVGKCALRRGMIMIRPH